MQRFVVLTGIRRDKATRSGQPTQQRQQEEQGQGQRHVSGTVSDRPFLTNRAADIARRPWVELAVAIPQAGVSTGGEYQCARIPLQAEVWWPPDKGAVGR